MLYTSHTSDIINYVWTLLIEPANLHFFNFFHNCSADWKSWEMIKDTARDAYR